MTLKKFKEILENAGMHAEATDYTCILMHLERLAWLEKHYAEERNWESAVEYESKRANAIHDALEAIGIYDGFDAMTV